MLKISYNQIKETLGEHISKHIMEQHGKGKIKKIKHLLRYYGVNQYEDRNIYG